MKNTQEIIMKVTSNLALNSNYIKKILRTSNLFSNLTLVRKTLKFKDISKQTLGWKPALSMNFPLENTSILLL